MRLLFVENHAEFASVVVAEFLSDHDVVVVPSITAARTAWVENPPDAMLVDYDLDDGKGDELVGELRRSGFTGRIIAVSSHEAGNQALLAAGADAVCPKTKFSAIATVLEPAG